MTIIPLAAVPPAEIEALLDRAFGSNRRARTAYRVRDGVAAIGPLSFAAVDAQRRLLASIQAWPVELAADDGARTPLVMVGPVAVEPAIQRGGLGQMLTRHMLDAARTSDVVGADALMLIGDPEYYARFFGFSAQHTGNWRLPGPFDPRRLLARGDRVPDRAGMVGPRVYAPATAA